MSQVDEPAIVEALRTHEIAGAGLDVLCTEPATLAVYEDLFALENVAVLPHAYAIFFLLSRMTLTLAGPQWWRN